MNYIDVLLLALLGVLVLFGLLRGLTRILVGLVALIGAFWLAGRYHESLAERLHWPDLGAYAAILIGTLVAGAVTAFLLRRLIRAAELGWVDRLAGAAVGLVAAFVVSALLILPLAAYSPFGDAGLQGSVLAPYVTVLTDAARGLASPSLAEKYEKRMVGLRRHWRERWTGELVRPRAPGASRDA